MKKSVVLFVLPVLFFIFNSSSCEETGGFTNVKGIETLIYQEIRDHRQNNGLTGPFVHQLMMIDDAQNYSTQMSLGLIPLDTTNIDDTWETIHFELGGTNHCTLVQKNSSDQYKDIVDYWRNDSTYNSKLLGNYTQCAVGAEKDTAGMAFVTVLLMLAE